METERIVIDVRISDRGASALSTLYAVHGVRRPGPILGTVLGKGLRPDPRWFARGRTEQRIQPWVEARLAEDIATVARYERVSIERWIEALLVTAAADASPAFRRELCAASSTSSPLGSWRPSRGFSPSSSS